MVGDGARTVRDRKCGRGGDRVGYIVESDSGGRRADGGVRGDNIGGVDDALGAGGQGTGGHGGHESEQLQELHLERVL